MSIRIEVTERLQLPNRRQTFTFFREYLLFAPPGWRSWWRESGRGLPMVVSLHGASMDHNSMAAGWNYPSAWQDDLDHQFFVLVPGGTHTADDVASRFPNGATADVFAFPFDEKLIWNGSGTAVDVSRDDVGVVRQMVEHARGLLTSALPHQRFPALDDDRMFLHGYSNGAGLAHRLVAEEPDRWAAVWAQSGMMARQLGPAGVPAVFGPDPAGAGTMAVSCFFHHGYRDDTIPYGTNPSTGLDPYNVGPSELDKLINDGGLDEPAARSVAFYYGRVPDAVERYRQYNRLTAATVPETGLPSVRPLLGGTSDRWVHPAGSLLNAENPQVVEYQDSHMTHINLDHPPTGYGSFAEVWDFFRTHPRVARPQ